MTAILLISIIFIAFISLILNSIKRIFTNHYSPSKANIILSVIVAAKNEEENIPALIDFLSNQSYSSNLFEVIIIDDNSSDGTFNKATSLTKGFDNFSVYKAVDKKFPGKKGALQFGIERAKNPSILITDADCLPEKKWIESFASKLDLGNDFAFGVAPFIQNKKLVNKISCFENLRTHLLTFGSANLGLPYSATARSFGFRKDSFEKLSGYENTTETLSGDDDLLLREAVKHKMKIGIVADNDSFVYSETPKSFSDYLKQKARHTSTSIHYLFIHKLILSIWHLINLIMLFSPLLVFVNTKFLILFLVKLFGDIYLISSTKNYFNYKFNFLGIIFYQVIYEILLIVNFFNAIFRKVKWK